ncbi:hypothetical protein PTTG_28634 [Puccinia triticina 1-1 BBBD Race 1]|uniref:Uncharacterized protein n=1 Tax=Puccinia triticina (isolate 1-1 / race 1 (BBBD)) TaxID=630390 RepID=A0A180GCH2_PUCT1|nr:hypothetical protein PTTG_28634 [Puccinia triticina 1-1 BBBD Race 1]
MPCPKPRVPPLLQPCEDDGPTHNKKVDKMRRQFPKIKAWLDWWTMADVKAMLFPSRRKMLEDCPNGDDGLPSSTNAQESMHRVYYMFSSGKKTLKDGFAELYAFVKALEMDHAMIQWGCPICYGTKARNQEDLSHSIGWIKPTKCQRATLNDGRTPDTTQALLDNPKKQPKLAKHQRFPAYNLQVLFCIVAAKPEELMLVNKNLKSILTQGSNKLFEAARNLHPESFITGEFSSCDFFMEIALSPQLNSSTVLDTLFTIQESQTFTCPRKIHQKKADHPRGERQLGCLKISRSMFEENAISFANAGLLVTRWATSGLSGTSGLQCKGCNALAGNKSRPKKKSGILPPSNHLEEVLTISFADSKSPPHLYFHIDVTTISDEDKLLEFMGQMNWPFKIMVAGEVYTLMLQGYWGGHHYWGKVLRKVCGVTGVWLHNDWVNGGYAQMVDPVPGSISGAHPHTSWLIYSRAWTDKEAAFVDESIQRIQQDNPKFTAAFPFTHMKTFLNISYNGEVTVDSLNPPSSPKKKLIRATSSNYLGSKISSDESDSEDSSVSSSKSSLPNHEDTSEHGASDESEDNGDAPSSDEWQHADTPTSPPSRPIKIWLWLNKTQKT